MPIRDLVPLAGLMLLLAAGPAAAQAPVGQIGAISGTALQRPAGQDWQAAQSGAPLRPGDALQAPADSVARVALGDAAAALAGGSLAIGMPGAEGGVLALSQGLLALGTGPGPGWRVDMAGGAVRLDAPARLLIEAGDGPAPARVSVLDGSARILPAGLAVAAGQTALIDGDPAAPRLAIEPTPPLDDARRALADVVLAPTAAPVPPVMPPPVPPADVVAQPEAARLAQFGSWVAEPGWGTVWYPAGVPAGWSPYAAGGPSWVASWGPVPWREGRWVRLGGRWGWCPGPPARRPAMLPPPAPPVRALPPPPPPRWHPPAATPAWRAPTASRPPPPHPLPPALRPPPAPAARAAAAPLPSRHEARGGPAPPHHRPAPPAERERRRPR